MRPTDGSECTHWLLPVNPAAHAERLPADWRTRHDATGVWEAIGRTQAIDRWCLSSGFRTMRSGDRIWAYLSRRQEVCAVGVVRDIIREAGRWFVMVEWDEARTGRLGRDPLRRSTFVQVPLSTCRADAHASAVLSRCYADLGSVSAAPAPAMRRVSPVAPTTPGAPEPPRTTDGPAVR